MNNATNAVEKTAVNNVVSNVKAKAAAFTSDSNTVVDLNTIVAERKAWEVGAYRTSNQQLYAILAKCLCYYLQLSACTKKTDALRVSYDAFPYQRFGQYHGVVHSVSQTDVPMAANPDKQDRRAYFLVRVQLDKSSVKAYDAEIPLRSGLTLTADIEIDRRSLIRWMLDPLFAFTGKL